MTERRHKVLTDDDIAAIVEALQCNKCSFSHEEADVLKSIARNTNRATKLATRTIVTGMVLGFLTMVWFAIKHLLLEIITTGKIPGK